MSLKLFWERWGKLKAMGLIQMVPHLIEADSDEAQVIYPLGFEGDGEPVERELAEVAYAAAIAMLPSGEAAEYRNGGDVVAMAPVSFEKEKVELVGVYRLTYRARTGKAAAWWAKLQGEYSEYAATFRKIAAERAARRYRAAE